MIETIYKCDDCGRCASREAYTVVVASRLWCPESTDRHGPSGHLGAGKPTPDSLIVAQTGWCKDCFDEHMPGGSKGEANDALPAVGLLDLQGQDRGEHPPEMIQVRCGDCAKKAPPDVPAEEKPKEGMGFDMTPPDEIELHGEGQVITIPTAGDAKILEKPPPIRCDTCGKAITLPGGVRVRAHLPPHTKGVCKACREKADLEKEKTGGD